MCMHNKNSYNMYICIHIQIHMYACIYTHTYTYMYIYIYIHTYRCFSVCVVPALPCLRRSPDPASAHAAAAEDFAATLRELAEARCTHRRDAPNTTVSDGVYIYTYVLKCTIHHIQDSRYIHVHILIYIYIYICIYIYTRASTYPFAYAYAYAYTYTYIHTHKHTYAYTYTYIQFRFEALGSYMIYHQY